MPYTYNNGALAYTPAYIPQTSAITRTSTASVKTDNIRLSELYVESDSNLDKGHLAAWTGEPGMFSNIGERVNDFAGAEGHEFALGKVEDCSELQSKRVAGVILDTAATPDKTSFLHRGVHSTHPIFGNEHILRLATSGSVVLAWVLQAHENQLEGLYQEFVNGTEERLYVVRELGEDHFSLAPVADVTNLEDKVAILEARLDELTASGE